MPDASKPDPPDFERVQDAFGALCDELRVVALQAVAQPSVRQLLELIGSFRDAIRPPGAIDEVGLEHLVRILHNSSEHAGSIYEYIRWQRLSKDQRSKRPPVSAHQVERLAITMRDSLGQLATMMEGDDDGSDE